MIELTTVVTSYRRPRFLERCLKSLVRARVDNVVLAAFVPDPAIHTLAQKFSKKFKTFRFVAAPTDPGVNELWLLGLYYADTPFVHLLHDDDFVTPHFRAVISETVAPQLESGAAAFAVCAGQIYQPRKKHPPMRHLDRPTGIYYTAHLMKQLMTEGHNAVSPVSCILDREVAIQSLKRWSYEFENFGHAMTNTMVAGNDLLLLMDHCERFESFVWVDEVVARYGHHAGSTTIIHMQGKNKLQAAYQSTRNRYKDRHTSSYYGDKDARIHVGWNTPKNRFFSDRDARAYESWKPYVDTCQIYPHFIDSTVVDGSKVLLGDPRDCACLHDIFDYMAGFALDEDWLVYANTDVGLIQDGIAHLKQALQSRECAYLWRRTLHHVPAGPIWNIKAGCADGGADVFAFRKRWWVANRRFLPRMFVANEAWDFVYWCYLEDWAKHRNHPSPQVHDLIWHAAHLPTWATQEVRSANPANLHNIRTAKNWFRVRQDLNAHNSVGLYSLASQSPVVREIWGDKL